MISRAFLPRPSWRLVSIFAAAGAVVAGLLYYFVISVSVAVAVFQTSRIGGLENVQAKVTPSLVLDRRAIPNILFERLQTRSFAEMIAKSLNEPELVDELPATQYGGKARLRVRGIGDGSLGEIRVRAKNPDLALRIANAVVQAAVATDQQNNAELLEIVNRRIEDIRTERLAMLKFADALSNTPAIPDDGRVLLAAFEARTRTQSLNDNLWALETGRVYPMAQNAEIFAPAAIATPIIKHWWMAVLLGLIAGAGLGYTVTLARHLLSDSRLQ